MKLHFKNIAWRRIGPPALAALGLVMLLAGGSVLAVNRLVIARGAIVVPANLAGLPLSSQTTGRAALTEIEPLHGKGFPLTDGAIAHYGREQATVWISSTWLPFMAARQIETMTDRIAEGRSPFTPTGVDNVAGVTVYTLTGMGQTHYYFQLDRRVAWLAVSPQLAGQSLEELIRNMQ